MNASAENRLLDAYISSTELIGDGFPARINARRSEYIETFKLAGLPTSRCERYLQSDIRSLYSGEWEICYTRSGEAAESPLTGIEGYGITTVNGFTDGRLHRAQCGMVYGSLRAAAAEMPEVVERYLNSVADNDDPVTALNSAFMQDGIFVYVPDGVKVPDKVVVDEQSDGETRTLATFGRTLVVLERGAEAEIVVLRRGSGRVIACGVREIVVADGARLSLTQVDCGGADMADVLCSYARQGENALCDVVSTELGDGFRRLSYATDLEGRGGETRLWGLYMDTENDHTDIDVRVRHAVPDCKSFEMVKGIASGNGTGAFSGLVYVAPDAQRTDAVQQSRNLLMSDTAQIHAKPQLEIYADDVKCSHGATVGQLDGEAVYYMRQRGLSLEAAERLQIGGFIGDIISHCPCPEVCRYMEELVTAKLERL